MGGKKQHKETNDCPAFFQLESEKLATYWFYVRKQYEILSLLIQSSNLNVSLTAFKQKQEKKKKRVAVFTVLMEQMGSKKMKIN